MGRWVPKKDVVSTEWSAREDSSNGTAQTTRGMEIEVTGSLPPLHCCELRWAPLTLEWGLLAVSGSGGSFYSGNYKAGQHNDREGRKPCEANRVKFGNGSGQR